MPLLKNNLFVEDGWRLLDDAEPLPSMGSIIVSWARLHNAQAELAGFTGSLGVAVTNTTAIDELVAVLPQVSLISLPFPAFADGRAYSLGRQIREAGFKGDLRATGNVLPDQYQMMLEVGFSSFVVSDRFPLQRWQQASQQMSLVYQRGLYRRSGEVEIPTARYGDAFDWEKQPDAR